MYVTNVEEKKNHKFTQNFGFFHLFEFQITFQIIICLLAEVCLKINLYLYLHRLLTLTLIISSKPFRP